MKKSDAGRVLRILGDLLVRSFIVAEDFVFFCRELRLYGFIFGFIQLPALTGSILLHVAQKKGARRNASTTSAMKPALLLYAWSSICIVTFSSLTTRLSTR